MEILIHILISFNNCRAGRWFNIWETSTSEKFIREANFLWCIKDDNRNRLATEMGIEAWGTHMKRYIWETFSNCQPRFMSIKSKCDWEPKVKEGNCIGPLWGCLIDCVGLCRAVCGSHLGFPLYALWTGSEKWASLVAHMIKCVSAMQETWVWSLGWEDPLEREMAACSSSLAWKILWMEEPGRL